MGEFELIEKFFKTKTCARDDVILGIGDDAALMRVPSNQLLVSSIDTLVADVHFSLDTDPFDIGYKALAVNISDLAAMGAEPAWMTLALTLPEANTSWLEKFSAGLFSLANQFNIQLIGGDTTQGPLNVTIQISGFVPEAGALCRHGAKVGDKIYVSGTLGDAGLGLQITQGKRSVSDLDKTFLLGRLNRPTPRVSLGLALRGIATSAIDLSDGLIADLNHILKNSRVGAHIFADKLPLSPALQNNLTLTEAQQLALTAGDDYELCFTVPPEYITHLNQYDCACIGTIEAELGLRISGFSGHLTSDGFQHF